MAVLGSSGSVVTGKYGQMKHVTPVGRQTFWESHRGPG